jgi:hypothetical protein
VNGDSIAERISFLREQADQARDGAAKFAGFAVLSFLTELASIPMHSDPMLDVARVCAVIGGALTTSVGVSYGLDSVQAGREVAALCVEQIRNNGDLQ